MLKAVCTLASQIIKTKNVSRSEAFKAAWQLIKQAGDAAVLTFQKVSGEVTTRVVSSKWFEFHQATGGKSTNKPGQMIFADLCKVAVGLPCIISTFQQNIVAFAA
jgi:hypothetical protein